LAKRFAPEDDAEIVRKKLVQEVLPRDTANYIQKKEPEDLFAAADVASKHFRREGLDESSMPLQNLGPITLATRKKPIQKKTVTMETATEEESTNHGTKKVKTRQLDSHVGQSCES